MSGEMDAAEDSTEDIVPTVEEPLELKEIIQNDEPVEEALDEPIEKLNDQAEEPLIQYVGEPLRDPMLDLAEQSSIQDEALRDKDHLDHLDHLDNLDNLADAYRSDSLSTNASLTNTEEHQETALDGQEPVNTKAALKTERKKKDRPARSTDASLNSNVQSGSIKSTRQFKLNVIGTGSNTSKQSGASIKSKEKKKVKGSKVVTHRTSQANSPIPTLLKSGNISDVSILSVPSSQSARSTSRRSSRGSLGPRTPRARSIMRDSKPVTSKDSNPNLIRSSLRKAKKRPESRRSESKKSLGKLKKKPTENILHSDEGSLSELSGTLNLSVSRDTQDEVDMIHKRNSMLALLNEIPDIEHLSEGSYCSLFGHKRSDYDGHFVPPTWDGGSESSSLKSPEPSLKHQETASAVEKVDEESSSEFVSFDSHSLLNLDSLSDSVDRFPVSANKVRAIDEEVDVARTLNSIIIRNSHINMVDFYNENLENQRRAALEACEYFLDEIIQRVVAYSDQEDVHLRRVLDKDKLIRELIPLMKQFSEEQLFKTTMEQRVTDHFARKKQFVFLKIPKTFDALNYQRLKSSLVELDRLLEVHNQTFDLAQMQSIKLTEELESARIYSDRKVQDFEQFVRTTLLNDRSNHLAGVVNEILSNMSSFRDELSELRLELLYNQHRLAEMQLKSEVLEDLGDGLKMQEYLSKQSDVLVLGTKIAERDAELNRLLGKINFDVHALAHVKCKEHMYRKVYLEMKQKLEECKRSRRHYRELIYQSKLKHNRFLRELHKIRTSGSLMHYPSLLDDYDKTVEFLQLKRAAVEKLRCEHRRLTQRISTRETKLSKQRSTIRLSGATNLLGEPLIVITGFNVSPTAS